MSNQEANHLVARNVSSNEDPKLTLTYFKARFYLVILHCYSIANTELIKNDRLIFVLKF